MKRIGFLLVFVMVFMSWVTSVSANESEVIKVAEEVYNTKGHGSGKPLLEVKYSDVYGNGLLQKKADEGDFVYYVMKKAGYGFVGYEFFDQLSRGVKYNKFFKEGEKTPQPGDLVFFSKGDDPSDSGGWYTAHPVEIGEETVEVEHVAIYAGNNMIYDMSQEAGTIAKRSLDGNSGSYKTSAGYLKDRIIGYVRYEETLEDIVAPVVTPTVPEVQKGEEETPVKKEDQYEDYFNDRKEVSGGRTGVDNRESVEGTKVTYLGKGWLSGVSKWIWKITQVISILLIGYVSILWMLYFLGKADIWVAHQMLLKTTANKVDSGAEGSLQTMLVSTGMLFLFSVIILTGLIPVIISGIYWVLQKILEWIWLFT